MCIDAAAIGKITDARLMCQVKRSRCQTPGERCQAKVPCAKAKVVDARCQVLYVKCQMCSRAARFPCHSNEQLIK